MASQRDDDRVTIPGWVVWIVGTLVVLFVLFLVFVYLVIHNLTW